MISVSLTNLIHVTITFKPVKFIYKKKKKGTGSKMS